MCICTYMYIHVYVYLYVCIHEYMYMYIRINGSLDSNIIDGKLVFSTFHQAEGVYMYIRVCI
jgi:hypothetical protein